MTARADHSFVSKVRHVIAFVAIVWAIAATFVAFEVVSLSAVDFVLRYPDLFGDLMLSRTVTESTSCTVADGSGQPQRPASTSNPDADVGAWLLGLSLGRDALFRQYAGSNSQVLEELRKGRDETAARLAVPSPAPFTPRQFANANTEFVTFVEGGAAAETARTLAATHSPRACELFKLGAMWGYSEMVRPVLPGERAVFGAEIRHYGRRAGVPEQLWSPMLQVTAADAKREDLITSGEAMTESVTKYLAGDTR